MGWPAMLAGSGKLGAQSSASPRRSKTDQKTPRQYFQGVEHQQPAAAPSPAQPRADLVCVLQLQGAIAQQLQQPRPAAAPKQLGAAALKA